MMILGLKKVEKGVLGVRQGPAQGPKNWNLEVQDRLRASPEA